MSKRAAKAAVSTKVRFYEWRVLSWKKAAIHMSAQAGHACMGLQAERRSIMDERTVLCAASAYEQKFYINPEFETLPESIRQELQIMCVLYTEDVGGVLMVVFDEDGNLELQVDHEENDFTFDEIGSVLKIKELQQTKRELFESLEMFYRVFCLGEDMEE